MGTFDAAQGRLKLEGLADGNEDQRAVTMWITMFPKTKEIVSLWADVLKNQNEEAGVRELVILADNLLRSSMSKNRKYAEEFTKFLPRAFRHLLRKSTDRDETVTFSLDMIAGWRMDGLMDKAGLEDIEDVIQSTGSQMQFQNLTDELFELDEAKSVNLRRNTDQALSVLTHEEWERMDEDDRMPALVRLPVTAATATREREHLQLVLERRQALLTLLESVFKRERQKVQRDAERSHMLQGVVDRANGMKEAIQSGKDLGAEPVAKRARIQSVFDDVLQKVRAQLGSLTASSTSPFSSFEPEKAETALPAPAPKSGGALPVEFFQHTGFVTMGLQGPPLPPDMSLPPGFRLVLLDTHPSVWENQEEAANTNQTTKHNTTPSHTPQQPKASPAASILASAHATPLQPLGRESSPAGSNVKSPAQGSPSLGFALDVLSTTHAGMMLAAAAATNNASWATRAPQSLEESPRVEGASSSRVGRELVGGDGGDGERFNNGGASASSIFSRRILEPLVGGQSRQLLSARAQACGFDARPLSPLNVPTQKFQGFKDLSRRPLFNDRDEDMEGWEQPIEQRITQHMDEDEDKNRGQSPESDEPYL